MERNAYALLVDDPQAWEFGCFTWTADDRMVCHYSAIEDYLVLKRMTKVIRKSEPVTVPTFVSA